MNHLFSACLLLLIFNPLAHAQQQNQPASAPKVESSITPVPDMQELQRQLSIIQQELTRLRQDLDASDAKIIDKQMQIKTLEERIAND